jgi:hypothetical protein
LTQVRSAVTSLSRVLDAAAAGTLPSARTDHRRREKRPSHAPICLSCPPAVTVWSVQTPQNTFAVDASSSPDQVTWTTPVTLGQGVEPKVVLTSDGHAIAVWQALNGATSLGIQASVRTPAGTWSSSAGIQTSTLPAGGHWSAPVTLSTNTNATPAIAVAPDGTALIAWGPSDGNVQASTSSITGPWTSPATVSLDRYHMRGLKVTLNDGILPTVTLSNSTWSTP